MTHYSKCHQFLFYLVSETVFKCLASPLNHIFECLTHFVRCFSVLCSLLEQFIVVIEVVVNFDQDLAGEDIFAPRCSPPPLLQLASQVVSSLDALMPDQVPSI